MSICTTVSRELTEPLAGTAPRAAAWLLIEQAGPWGPRALTESHFDPELGRALQRQVRGTGVEIALIRRPGKHADRPPTGERSVYLAHTAPSAAAGGGWVREAQLADPSDLLDLDFAAIGAGTQPGFGTPYSGDPLALVCTNGRRDRCCALLGRPLAADLAAAGHAQVWEVTHLGGHRFSPTMLVLPYGYAYGRLSAHTAKEVLEATRAGLIMPEWCRGRTFWDRPGQAAELAVRRSYAVEGVDELVIEQVADTTRHPEDQPDGWTVRVAHLDGRAWQARVRRTAADPARPESCLKAPTHPDRFDVITLEPLHGALATRGNLRA
ncbi:hypothetical protein ABIA32_005230 [Streptacidiphilus sp. MAP12-20]|uniref:sucrase ferredoxin n=1 Tax=Streptacidiphilus sp. MAP12-20 TaxID=3156299 RepID=UPI0035139220